MAEIGEGAISAAAAERCTKQSALTVGRNVKFRSSPQKAALSTARNALRNADHQEDGNKVSKGVRFRAGGLNNYRVHPEVAEQDLPCSRDAQIRPNLLDVAGEQRARTVSSLEVLFR